MSVSVDQPPPMKHPGYTQRTMSERRTHGRELLSALVTYRYDSKHGYEPPSVHRARDANHRREDEGQETTDLDAQSYETWYPSPSDETTSAIQDLPSTTVSPVNEPTADASMVSLTRSPLKILNMTNIPNKLPHPLASNLIVSPQASHTGTAKPTPQTQQTPHHLPEKIFLTLVVTGGVVFLILWAAIRLGSCKRPRWRWRRSIPPLPTVRDRKRTQGDGGLGIPLSLSRKQNHTPPQRIYKSSHWTRTNYQSGIPRPTPPATIGRSTSQGMLGNANATSGQEINKRAEQDQYPFTGAGNCASSSAPPTQRPPSAAPPVVSRLSTVSILLQPNSSDYSQLGSEIGLAIDTPTGPDQRQKLVSWSSVRSLTRAVKGAAVLRRSAVSFASSDSQTSAAIGRALIKATYYTPSPYPRESIPSPSRSQCTEEHDCQQERGLRRSKTQRGQERGVQTPTPDASSLVSSRPALETNDLMEVTQGATNTVSAYSQNQPVSSSDITNEMIVDPAASGSPTSLSAASFVSTLFRTSAGELSEESRDLLAGTLPNATSLEKEVEEQPPRERPLPPTPPLDQTYTDIGSAAADDDSVTDDEGEICTSSYDG